MEKYRSSGVVTGELLAGDVSGKAAIIVDDLISTGGTLIRAAEACRRAGTTKVFAAAAHGLFVGGAPALFATPALDSITVTEEAYQPKAAISSSCSLNRRLRP